MKRALVSIFLIVLLILPVLADENQPSSPVSDQEVAKIQNATETFVPLNEKGEFDSSKYAPIKTKAEQRIDAINQWFVDNAPWLAIIFGIVPAISWLFLVNLYFMFLFLIIVLNMPGRKSKIIAAVAYLIFLIPLKLYVLFSKGIIGLVSAAWDASTILGILVAIVVAIILLALPAIVQKILTSIGSKSAKAREELDRKVLHTQVESMGS